MNLPEMFRLQSEGSLSVKKTIKVYSILMLTSQFILGKTMRNLNKILPFQHQNPLQWCFHSCCSLESCESRPSRMISSFSLKTSFDWQNVWKGYNFKKFCLKCHLLIIGMRCGPLVFSLKLLTNPIPGWTK